MERVDAHVEYPATQDAWDGLGFSDHFAVRWSGYLDVTAAGDYTFSLLSDDGSRLLVNELLTVDNGDCRTAGEGLRLREGTARGMRQAKHELLLEYFENTWEAGMVFKYSGPDTGSAEVLVPDEVRDSRRGLFHRGLFQNIGFCSKLNGKQHCSNTDTTCNHLFFETTPFETTPYASPKRCSSARPACSSPASAWKSG